MKAFIKNVIYALFSPVLIRRGKAKCIYITFDDGPHPENTPEILKILSNFNVKATFFMTGEEMEKYSKLVSEVINQGHAIGYHSYRHKSMKEQSSAEFIDDLKKSDEICSTFSYKTRLYRPPYGDLSLFGFFWLIIHGWKIIMWSKDSRDSFDTLEQVKANVSPTNLECGEVLLFHDDYQLTVKLLPFILNEYKNAKLCCSRFN
jgi:peptidoglycan-N-acetylglucosamine deacetylase